MNKCLMKSLIIILYILYFISLLVHSNFWGDILSPVVTLISVGYVFKGFIIDEKSKIIKIAGAILAFGILSWALCDIFWGVEELILNKNPENTFINIYGYSLTNLCLVIALIIFGVYEIKKWNRIHILLDFGTVAIYTIVFIWIIFFDQNIKQVMIFGNNIVSVISISSDLIILMCTSLIFLSSRKGKIHPSIRYLLSGESIFAIADLIYYYQYYYSTYKANSLLDGVYVIGFGLITIGTIKKMETSDNKQFINVSNMFGSNKGVLLIILPIMVMGFKQVPIYYILILLYISLIYFIFADYIEKNMHKDELLLKEKEVNDMLEQLVEDRTQKLKLKNEELNYLVNRDIVTGLYNRRYFLNWLRKVLSRLNENETFLLLYIDLNRYKMITEMYGNYIGEQILKQVSKRLKDYILSQPDSMIAYYGEDTFIFCKRGSCTYETGFAFADEITDLCSDIYKINEYEIRVTVNIGISVYPIDAKGKEELIKHADIAMLQSTVHGFNKTMAYNSRLGDIIYRRESIEIMLRKVNFEEEFKLVYQPQVSMEDKKLIGFEALLRWKTKDGESISPVEFIPIAERTGIIIQIGEWVMKNALKQLASWNKNREDKIKLGINVSMKQLYGNYFVSSLCTEIERLEVNPEWLDVEITESIELEENPAIREALNQFDNMGISISIDDFGTGYSSLNYLNNLPIKYIKVARELVEEVCCNDFNYEIVKSVIAIAKVRGIKVIAEGVENEEQWECLKTLKCDEVQGYYVGRPMTPEEAFDKWINMI